MSIKRPYLIVSALSFIAISTLCLSSVSADTNTAQDNVAVSVPVSCTMNGTGMTSHTANIPNGTYESEIGTTTLKSFCNDSQGFAIYAIGYTNEEYGNTTLIGANQGQTIVTGTATTTGNPDVSNWAVKLATDSTATYPLTLDNGFNAYSSVPSSYTKVAHRDSGTDLGSSATGAELTTTYAAYISKGQKADTYDGKVKFTLVHPSDASTPLPPPTPPISCTNPVPNLTYMQDLNSSNKASVLTSMTEDSQYYLADKRDNKTYCVAKLKDGNIWMTQNLDHDIVTDGSVIYDNTTTDLGWNSSTSSYDVANWTPSSATSTTTWSSSNYCPRSYDPGELYWNGTTTSNPTDNQISSTGDPHYHLGNYYNWNAAVAINNSDGYYDIDMNQSICPANWTLPKITYGAGIGSFEYLVEQYGWSYDYMANPYIWNTAIKYSLGGGWSGAFYNIGSGGTLWSSSATAYQSDYEDGAWFFFANYDGDVTTTYSFDRSGGVNVRCVAR